MNNIRDRWNLTKTELRLVIYLMDHTGETVTRENLLTDVWGVPSDLAKTMATRVVDMTVARVRVKVKDFGTIKSVRGFGYRFEEN